MHHKLTTLGLALSTMAVSLSSPACPKPCGWYFQVEPFYAKATDSLLTNSLYAVKVADPMILRDTRVLYHSQLDNDWGGRLAIGYRMPSCLGNYDLSLAYTFFHPDNSSSVINNHLDHAGHPVLAPAEFIDITDESSARFSHASTQLKQRYDTVDLQAEKKIFGCGCLTVSDFAGIRFLHIKEQLNNNYEFVGPIQNVQIRNLYHINFSNTLNSAGPQLGTRIDYHFTPYLALNASLAGSFLYGQSDSEFNNDYFLSPASDLGPQTILTSSDHKKNTAHTTPALSGKIGINYTGNLNRCTYLEIELGYRGDKYFNAVDTVAWQELLTGDDVNAINNYQDFEISGPYASVTIKL